MADPDRIVAIRQRAEAARPEIAGLSAALDDISFLLEALAVTEARAERLERELVELRADPMKNVAAVEDSTFVMPDPLPEPTDPWDVRLDRLRKRCGRPVIAISREDLRLLLDQLNVWQALAFHEADETARLRAELADRERTIANLTPPLMKDAA